VRRWHTALLRLGITANMVEPSADLSGYRAVLAPSLYLVSDADAANVRSYVEGGGTLVVGAYSGIVNEADQIHLGGYPGALRDLLGVRVDEFFPLRAGQTIALADGAQGSVWSERARADGAEVLTTYADGPLAGTPALTRNGRAWYCGTRLVDADLSSLLATVCAAAGAVPPVPDPPPGLEVVRRSHPDGDHFLCLINHSTGEVSLDRAGTDLLTGAEHSAVHVPAGGVVILREAR